MVNYYEPPGEPPDTSPEGRARLLAEIAAGARLRAQQTAAVPALTGNSHEDLANAIDAAGRLEAQWDEADKLWFAARADAHPFADVEVWQRAALAERERDRAWVLLQRATAHRDKLQAAEDRLRDLPDVDLGEWRR